MFVRLLPKLTRIKINSFMNNKVLNCPNCGEKLECTKVDNLLGKHEYRCNNCHKQYSAKYNFFFYFITLFIIFTIANLLSRYILNQFSIVNYEWIISSIIWLIIVVVIFAIANKIEYIRKKLSTILVEKKICK